jgi:hypothetical protein
MANISAKDKVWSIPEVVEAIFFELLPRDLLVNAQRVSRDWNNTIKSSPVLQKRLFFQPGPKDQLREPKLNALLRENFPAFFTRANDTDRYDRKWPQEILSDADWNSSPKKIDAYSRKEASWRKMLVAQPPVTTTKVIKTTSDLGQDDRTEGKLSTPDGLRMGTLYDFVEGEVHSGSTHDSTSFDLGWNVLSTPQTQQDAGPPKYIPPHARDANEGLTIHMANHFSCCAVVRYDFEVPEHLKGREFKDMNREEQLQLMVAQMSRAIPHLRSKAYTPVHIEWVNTEITRGGYGLSN